MEKTCWFLCVTVTPLCGFFCMQMSFLSSVLSDHVVYANLIQRRAAWPSGKFPVKHTSNRGEDCLLKEQQSD